LRTVDRSTAAVRRVLIAAALLVTAAADGTAQRLLIRDLLPPDGADATQVSALHFGGVTAAGLFESDFLLAQLRHERVLAARIETRFATKKLFEERGIAYPAAELFVRVFKRERTLEVWARPQNEDTFRLLKTYAICALRGEPGPKRRQGDNQTPEGFYRIDRFNPTSNFFLSLHIDYPNRSDRLLGQQGALGGDIFIHGGCQTEGCIAVTDESIKEIYWLAVEARAAGQRTIPIHIFPFRMEAEDLEIAGRFFGGQPDLLHFWRSLEPGYRYFEEHRRVPNIVVAANGLYALAGEAAADDASSRLLGTPVGLPQN
jgi:murein L,D-transpeptidase YafK